MYGATYEEEWEEAQYYHMQNTNGSVFESPYGYTDPVGLNSNYLKIVAVGCNGCDDVVKLIDSKCSKKSKI